MAPRKPRAKKTAKPTDDNKSLLAYESASRGRIVRTWLPTGANADTEVSDGQALTSYRARDLVRNDGRAAQTCRQLALHIVGTGLRPRPQDPSDEMVKRAVVFHDRWARTCIAGSRMSIYGHQLQSVAAMFESGEALARRRARRSSDDPISPVAIQPLESDHLDASRNEPLTATVDGQLVEVGEIIQGVEFDAIESVAAYHLFKKHPGGSWNLAASMGGVGRVTQRIDAADVIHLYAEPFARPGQVRGVSWLAPAIIRLRQLGDYELAEGVRKKAAATQAIIVTGRSPVDNGSGTSDTLTGHVLTDADGNRVETMRPGMVSYAREESTVVATVPPADQSYPAHLETELHQLAAAWGVPYEVLTGDLSKVNFSSIQYGMLAFKRLCRMFRELIVIPMLCQREWDWFVDGCIARGTLPDRDYPVRFQADAWEEIDRGKAIDAAKSAIRAGLSTVAREAAALGIDPADLFGEIETEQKDLDKRGIVIESDPRRPLNGGQQTPAAEPAA